MSFHAISKHQCQIKKREWKWESSCSLRKSRNNWLDLNYLHSSPKKETVKKCNVLTNNAVKYIDCIFNIFLGHGQY